MILDLHRQGLSIARRTGRAVFPQLTATRLTREIRERGYTGAYTAVKRFVAAIRPDSGPKPFEVRSETPNLTGRSRQWTQKAVEIVGPINSGAMIMDEHEKLALARQQVEGITGFYIHLVVFVLVMAMLFVINLMVLNEVWWVQWALLGWGIGILAHGLIVLGQPPRFITKWQLKKLKEFKDKM